ncbi:MAG: phage baseplate protein [Candidatus Kurthia intestinigallinarum]
MSTKKLQILDYNVKQADNADTVDGKHADEFASTDDMATAQSDISDLQTKVGDTAVSTQISTAINEIDYPVDSVNGKTGAVELTASDVGALPSTTTIPSISGLATETYVNNKVAGIVNSAPETLDTLNELAAALGNDPNFATTVATEIGTKVDKIDGKCLSTNDYTTAEKTKLAGIETGANKTTVDSALSATSTNPVQNKVVNSAISNLNTLVGDTSVSTQITNAVSNKVDKVSGKGLSTNDYTTTEKNKLAGIAAGAEVNQNAFSNVVVGSTTIAADSKTDTLTLVAGSNVTLTPDSTNDKITIAAKDTTYSASTSTPLMDGTASVGTSSAYSRGDHVHPSDTAKVSKSGDTMTGELIVPNITVNYAATFNGVSVEGYGSDTYGESGFNFLGQNGDESVIIGGVGTPTADTHAANKAYVDSKWGEMQQYVNTEIRGIDTHIVDLIYPVGSIYISAISTSPATLFGGTWERIAGKFLVGVGNGFVVGDSGGSMTHKHTTGDHALTTNEMPYHYHNIWYPNSGGPTTSEIGYPTTGAKNTWCANACHTDGQGGGAAHNHGDTGSASNLPPYWAVYMWERTA